jgi:hypothetical protein
LLVIEIIRTAGIGSQMSTAAALITTGTILWFGGQIALGVAEAAVNVGGVVSTTLTVVVAVELFPDASVAVKVTLVVPCGNTAGALLDIVIGPQLSVALAGGTKRGVPALLVSSTVNGPGIMVNVGGV